MISSQTCPSRASPCLFSAIIPPSCASLHKTEFGFEHVVTKYRSEAPLAHCMYSFEAGVSRQDLKDDLTATSLSLNSWEELATQRTE